MDLLNLGGFNLRGLDRMNVLLGKNGCGKSRLLKLVEQAALLNPGITTVKYLSPERGGFLVYEPGIEQTLIVSPTWLADTRRSNQAGQFRQQSAAQFRQLEILVLREIERDAAKRADLTITFDRTIDQINVLLDRVQVKRAGPAFTIHDRKTGTQVQPQDISSGESELISLGIECLVFQHDCQPSKTSLLLIDEPDLHLHPDLQARLAEFLDRLTRSDNLTLIMATHSTALLGALSEDQHTHVAFMKYGDTDLTFAEPGQAMRKVLPVFGAHPLSNVFNQAPVLLVEGEDDERLWQQAVRSSEGRIKVYPCSVDGVAQLADFERTVTTILESVYDTAIGYSLRDRDSDLSEIGDIGPVLRMRLACRNAENLILSNEVLARVGVSWEELRERIERWLNNNQTHPHFAAMRAFADSGYNRKNSDLKDIRNDLMGLMGSNKPWEVAVGQSIASLEEGNQSSSPTALAAFLGPLVCKRVLRLGLSVAQNRSPA